LPNNYYFEEKINTFFINGEPSKIFLNLKYEIKAELDDTYVKHNHIDI